MIERESGAGRPKSEIDHPNVPGPPGHAGGPEVRIVIDGQAVMIHRGRQSVAAIKKAGSVPATYELEQVIDGKLVPLPDDGAVTIKGGEVFFGHPRDSCSS